VPAGAKPALSLVAADTTAKDRLARHKAVIQRVARLEAIDLLDVAPEGTVKFVLDGVTLALAVGGLIDFSEEAKRLAKEIAKLEKEIKSIENKLANEKFLAKAPADIVEEQHTRKTAAGVALDKLNDAAAQLRDLG